MSYAGPSVVGRTNCFAAAWSPKGAILDWPTEQKFISIEPQLAGELKVLLEQAGEPELAGQVESLLVIDFGDYNEGSYFYMLPDSSAPWGPGHRTLALRPGSLHVDVVSNQIVHIEALRKQREYRQRLKRAVPRGNSRELAIAGITSGTDDSGVRRWTLVGWSKEIGLATLEDVPFLLVLQLRLLFDCDSLAL